MFLGDNVHHAGYSVRTIERRGSPFHNFYFLYIERVDEREVILPSHITMNSFPVDQNQNIGVAKSVHLHLRAHVVFIETEGGSESGYNVFYAAAAILPQHARGDNLRLDRCILQEMLRASARNNNLLQRIGTQFILSCTYKDCAQTCAHGYEVFIHK